MLCLCCYLQAFSSCSAQCLGMLQSTDSGGSGLQPLWLPGSRARAQELWCLGLSCSASCGIFQDQGSNPCLLHGQADSLPLSHQGSLRQVWKVGKGEDLFTSVPLPCTPGLVQGWGAGEKVLAFLVLT